MGSRSSSPKAAHTDGWVTHSISILRVTMGLLFLGFGALKFIPGASPAQDLALATTEMLTFHAVPDPVALIGIATVESVIGLSLTLGRGLRVIIYLLAAELVGILSPLLLLPERLFPVPWHTPTLESQYVLKDIALVGAAMVVATTSRGARIALAADPQPVAEPARLRASAKHRMDDTATTAPS